MCNRQQEFPGPIAASQYTTMNVSDTRARPPGKGRTDPNMLRQIAAAPVKVKRAGTWGFKDDRSGAQPTPAQLGPPLTGSQAYIAIKGRLPVNAASRRSTSPEAAAGVQTRPPSAASAKSGVTGIMPRAIGSMQRQLCLGDRGWQPFAEPGKQLDVSGSTLLVTIFILLTSAL